MVDIEIHILIVEDQPANMEFFVETLAADGYKIFRATMASQALQLATNQHFDTILLDVKLPDGSGIDLCREIKQITHNSNTPVIFLTAYGDIDMAVKAMDMGAFYFLTKPVKPAKLQAIVAKAIENTQLRREVALLKSQLGSPDNLIGKSAKMQAVYQMIAKVAPRETTVLIQGNSGTGKELVAQAIHNNSPRQKYPFVPIDCGALSESLLESELFGHIKGAFTGANSPRKGIFVRANKGTLFLDEIGNLPLPLQIKLLRVLQEKEISPLGSDDVIKVDVRIIAATNVDLSQLVNAGKFRSDLFFRLNVISIKLPDLQERPEDIPILAQYFLDSRKNNGDSAQKFSKAAMKSLLDYPWPGNIRELKNAIEYATIVAMGEEIQVEDFPSYLQQSQENTQTRLTPVHSLMEVERRYIRQVLKYTNYNQSQAAKILEIDRKSLWRKIKRFTIEIPKT